jgi:hypothetical protein
MLFAFSEIEPQINHVTVTVNIEKCNQSFQN